MPQKITIQDRVYGQWEIDDPLAIALIELPEFQRLYKVGQYGSYWFGLKEADTNRAEHSLGVYYLARHFGANREEQIAALLHDISHTAFSHVIDYVYDDVVNQETQDKAHLSIISKSAICGLLEKHGFDYVKIADLEEFKILDKDLPDLCCDRLDYFLRDSICYNEFSAQEAQGILSHIAHIAGNFVVDDPDVARFMSLHSICMSENHWGPPFGCFIFERTANSIKRALKLGIITEKDFYKNDFEVWNKMKSSQDEEILLGLSDTENIKNIKLCLDKDNFDYHLTSKFRGIDPLVMINNTMRRVSDIFSDVVRRTKESKKIFDDGYYIKVVRD